MDVDKEFAAANRRLTVSLEKACARAAARAAGLSLEDYVATNYVSPMEALGAAYREMRDGLVNIMEQFNKGWESAGKHK